MILQKNMPTMEPHELMNVLYVRLLLNHTPNSSLTKCSLTKYLTVTSWSSLHEARMSHIFIRVFYKHITLVIIPILLASEALLRENKKIPVTKCYPSEYWTLGSLIPSPTLSVKSQSKFRYNVVSNDARVPGVAPNWINSRTVRNVKLGLDFSPQLNQRFKCYCMHVYIIYFTAVVWFVR